MPERSESAAPPVTSPPVAAGAVAVFSPDAGDAGVSGASRRLRALALLSGSLTDPLSPEDAADVVERQAFAVLGATSAVVVTLDRFPPTGSPEGDVAPGPVAPSQPSSYVERDAETLTLVHAIGVPAHVAAALQRLRLDAQVPLAEVARTGEPVFLGSESEMRRYPEWCGAILAAGSCAAAAVPVWANGHLRGVLGLTWTTPHTFDEDERAFVLTLGVMCAQAIMRGHLTVAERRARHAAEHANREKTQFLRTMSHELRTPLNAMLGYTQLLAEEIVGPVNAVQQEHFRRVRRSGHHLLSLIEELLRFARLDSGKELVQVERVIASELVEDTVDIIRPIAELKGIRVRVEVPEAPIELYTDRLKLRQILVNLATNAVKYTDAGSVVLILKVEGLGAEMRIYFEVTDTGRGISVAHQPHLFEAFWRADHPTEAVSGGTGLGLSVARQLARLLGGDVIMAHTELAHGSTFIASLPMRYPGAPSAPALPGALEGPPAHA